MSFATTIKAGSLTPPTHHSVPFRYACWTRPVSYYIKYYLFLIHTVLNLASVCQFLQETSVSFYVVTRQKYCRGFRMLIIGRVHKKAPILKQKEHFDSDKSAQISDSFLIHIFEYQSHEQFSNERIVHKTFT